MTSGLEFPAQLIGIVECTVVNEGDFARGVGVRMGIGIGLASVGGPASMSDADVVAIVDAGALVDEVETVGLFALGCKFRHHLPNASEGIAWKNKLVILSIICYLHVR